MSARSISRGQKGRFVKGPSIDEDGFAVPRPRREIIPRQERSWMSSVFFIGSQAKDRTEIDTTRVYSAATFFSWIVVALCAITKVILWVLIFLTLKNLILGDGVTLFVKTANSCIKQSEGSCYAKMTDAFFPLHKTFAWISFRVDTADYAHSLLAGEFAVHLNNPVVLLGATVTTAMTGLFLSYIHTFLSSTANIARRVALQALN